MENFGLVDIDPSILLPTWSSKRVGADIICKRLDRLLVSADLLDYEFHFCQWVGYGGDSNHQSVFLQILNIDLKSRSPFKFNAHWFVKEDLVTLLKDSWNVYIDNPVVLHVVHFAANLKRIKDVSIAVC